MCTCTTGNPRRLRRGYAIRRPFSDCTRSYRVETSDHCLRQSKLRCVDHEAMQLELDDYLLLCNCKGIRRKSSDTDNHVNGNTIFFSS